LIKIRIKDTALMGYKTYIPPKLIFSDDEFKIIEGLQKDNNIYLMLLLSFPISTRNTPIFNLLMSLKVIRAFLF
jgi:hypothetical protein